MNKKRVIHQSSRLPEDARHQVGMISEDEESKSRVAGNIRLGYIPTLCLVRTALAYFEFEIMDLAEDPKILDYFASMDGFIVVGKEVLLSCDRKTLAPMSQKSSTD